MSNTSEITAVIGLGTGRCGTTSLAELLSMQGGVICSHWSMEYVRWAPTDRTRSGRDVKKALAWWEGKLKVAGEANAAFRADVSPWHVNYIEHYLEAFASVAVVVLHREREATAKSWESLSQYRFLRKNDTSARRCFPTFPEEDAYTAAIKYWDAYQEKVNALIKRYPETIHRFDIDALNTRQGQKEILDGIGLKGPAQRRYPKDCTFHTIT